MATKKIYSPLTSSSGMEQTSAPKHLRAKPYDVSIQPSSQNRGALSNLRSPTVSRTAQFPSQPPSTNNFYSSSPVLAPQQSMWVARPIARDGSNGLIYLNLNSLPLSIAPYFHLL